MMREMDDERLERPILPRRWYGTTVRVAFVDDGIPQEVGMLIESNATGVLLDVGRGQRFFAWCAVRFVGVDNAPRGVAS